MPEDKKINAEEFEEIINNAENSYVKGLSKDMLKILVGMIIFCLYIMIPKTFWLIPSKLTIQSINTDKDPVMILNEENIRSSAEHLRNSTNLIKIKSFKNNETYYILPLAEYSISARIKEKNKFFYMQWEIDNLALVDYGMTWGDMAKNKYFNKLYANSNQSVMGRLLVFNFKDRYYNSMRYKYDYMIRHVSHTHAIPANKNVKKALNAIREGQKVKLEGYLIDAFDKDFRRFAMSSLSLYDTNESARGGGACEIMYVTKVQVGSKVFE